MLLKRTLNVALLLVLVTGTISFGLARASQEDADTAVKIENVMSAAPTSLAEYATRQE